MRINLLKAIKSTHRNPDSKILHFIGLSLYVIGFILITGYYFNNLNISSLIYGIVLFPIAVGLFLIGHKKEGNLRAMTIIVIMKYLRSKLVLTFHRRKHLKDYPFSKSK
jgi:TctA family transporter